MSFDVRFQSLTCVKSTTLVIMSGDIFSEFSESRQIVIMRTYLLIWSFETSEPLYLAAYNSSPTKL